MLDIIKAYAVKNLCYITAKKMTPKGIVVHSTGANNPYLKRYVDAPQEVGTNKYGNHWNQPTPDGRKVCVHAFIGLDEAKKVRIAEILPLNICCWGVGQGKKGSYNYDPAYIQFEVCEDGLADKNYYDKVFEVAAEYCAGLCKTYGISVDNVVGHCEAYKLGYGSNHSDPENWMKRFNETMEDFRKKVYKYLESENVQKENEENTSSAKENTKNTAETLKMIQKGDLVSIAPNAKYYDGHSMPSWVKKQNWFVRDEPVGDRAVLDKNESGTNSICSPVHKKYLTVVKKHTENVANVSKGFSPYLVKVTANCLNIRKGAGTNTAKAGAITDRGIYTIVEEKDGKGATKWGKLKSGAGWISLDYVKRV